MGWRALGKRIMLTFGAIVLVGGLAIGGRFVLLGRKSRAMTPTLGVRDGDLLPCGSPTNCVRETFERQGELSVYLARAEEEIRSLGGRVVDRRNGYLHAEFESRLFGFVDDLEMLASDSSGTVVVRSASRVGTSDLGVNGRRVATLRARLR